MQIHLLAFYKVAKQHYNAHLKKGTCIGSLANSFVVPNEVILSHDALRQPTSQRPFRNTRPCKY